MSGWLGGEWGVGMGLLLQQPDTNYSERWAAAWTRIKHCMKKWWGSPAVWSLGAHIEAIFFRVFVV